MMRFHSPQNRYRTLPVMPRKRLAPNLGEVRYFKSVAEAMGAVDQGSYRYYDSEQDRIRKEAEEAEAQYDRQMQIRREAEAAEAQYDANQAYEKSKAAYELNKIRSEAEAAEAKYDASQKKPVMAAVPYLIAAAVVLALLVRR